MNQRRTPVDLYRKIIELHPSGRRSDFFFLEAHAGEDEASRLVERIVKLCQEQGLKATQGQTVGSYVYTVRPVYDRGDLETAPLLWLATQRNAFQDCSVRDKDKRICIPAVEAERGVLMGSVFPKPWVVISDPVRRVMKQGHFVGIEFGPVSLTGTSGTNTVPLWELQTSTVLPKMTNSKQNAVTAAYNVDDAYGEPHYNKLDLDRLGSFDLARTLEPLQANEPWLVVSQRLFRHLLTNAIPVEAKPVRVDAA